LGKKSVGRPVRGGHRSIARAGSSGVDAERTRVDASLDCEVSLCNTMHRTHAVPIRPSASSDQSSDVGCLASAMESSAEHRLSSNTMSSGPLLDSLAATQLHSSPVMPSVDDSPQVLPAIAVLSQPYQNRLMSSPNNSDTPPSLDECTVEISGTSLLDARHTFSQKSLIGLLAKDNVSQENTIKDLSSNHPEQIESVERCKAVVIAEPLVTSSAESLPRSMLPVQISSIKPAAPVTASSKPILGVQSLSTLQSRKSSSTQKFILCKGWYQELIKFVDRVIMFLIDILTHSSSVFLHGIQWSASKAGYCKFCIWCEIPRVVVVCSSDSTWSTICALETHYLSSSFFRCVLFVRGT
jgi:hypothetical protein